MISDLPIPNEYKLKLMNVTSTITIEHMHYITYIFATCGLPKILVSDNDSIFTSTELSQFVKHNGIQHVKPALYHAASNALTERAVQTFKAFMKSTAGSYNKYMCIVLSVTVQNYTTHALYLVHIYNTT